MEGPEVPLEAAQEHIHEHAHEHGGEPKARWILGVALTSAIVAALAAVAALKAGHHANEALIAQIDANNWILKASNQWAYYQAKGVKLAVLTNKIEMLRVLRPTTPGAEPSTVAPAAETAAPPAAEPAAADARHDGADSDKAAPGAEPAAADPKHEGAKLDKAAKKKETDEEKAKRYDKEQEEIKNEAEEYQHKAEELKKEGEEHLEQHVGLAKSVTMFQICIAISAVSVLTNRKAFWFVSLLFAAYGVYAMALGLMH